MELINVTYIKSTYFLWDFLKNINISEELCYSEIDGDNDGNDNDNNDDVVAKNLSLNNIFSWFTSY